MEPFLCVVRNEIFVYSLDESLPFKTVLWLRNTMEGAFLIHNGGTPIINIDCTEHWDCLYFVILKISKCWYVEQQSLDAKKRQLVASLRPCWAEFHPRVGPCEICGWKSGSGTDRSHRIAGSFHQWSKHISILTQVLLRSTSVRRL